MAKEKSPENEEIEIRVGDEIPFEDETGYKAEAEEPDVVGELRNLGQQFADTVRSAWHSDERRQFQEEMHEGVQTFASEIDKAVKDIMDSDPAQKARTEAESAKTRAESSDVGNKTRTGVAYGLRRFSEELSKLADSFTPDVPEQKEPPADEF